MIALMDKYSDQEFEEIVKRSTSYKDCLKNLGYNSNSGDSTKRLRKKIDELGLDTSHFSSNAPVKRTKENVFVEHSTCSQKTLRQFFQKEPVKYICSICGQEPIWRGKELTLILDHINGVNNDDRIENLRWVCPNCNQQLETTNARNPNRIYEQKFCIDCGKAISKNAVRCADCERIFRKSQPVEVVSREELKSLIRSTPFTVIGKNFGVSDNAVRKWCIKYSLPSKVSEIKQIPDNEWDKI